MSLPLYLLLTPTNCNLVLFRPINVYDLTRHLSPSFFDSYSLLFPWYIYTIPPSNYSIYDWLCLLPQILYENIIVCMCLPLFSVLCRHAVAFWVSLRWCSFCVATLWIFGCRSDGALGGVFVDTKIKDLDIKCKFLCFILRFKTQNFILFTIMIEWWLDRFYQLLFKTRINIVTPYYIYHFPFFIDSPKEYAVSPLLLPRNWKIINYGQEYSSARFGV